MAKCCNIEPQPTNVVTNFNDFIFPFKILRHWNDCVWNNGDKFMAEGTMGWILVLTKRFIPNNTKKCFMKSHKRSSDNPLQLRVVHIPSFVDKQIVNKKLHLLIFCPHIVKGWRYTPINRILNIEEPVGKSLYKSHVSRQGSEYLTRYVMKDLGLPPIKKIEIINGYFLLGHSINFLSVGLLSESDLPIHDSLEQHHKNIQQHSGADDWANRRELSKTT